MVSSRTDILTFFPGVHTPCLYLVSVSAGHRMRYERKGWLQWSSRDGGLGAEVRAPVMQAEELSPYYQMFHVLRGVGKLGGIQVVKCLSVSLIHQALREAVRTAVIKTLSLNNKCHSLRRDTGRW